MCQDEDENQSFGSFWNLCMTNEPVLKCIIVLRAWFVRHRLYPERTKFFVFGLVFVFVLAHEQPITMALFANLAVIKVERGVAFFYVSVISTRPPKVKAFDMLKITTQTPGRHAVQVLIPARIQDLKE